jgi:hypothetical protein
MAGVSTNNTSNDVWFSITGTGSADSIFVRLLGNSTFNGKIELRDATTNALLNNTVASDSMAAVGTNAIAKTGSLTLGQVIYVRVINKASASTTGSDNYVISAWRKANPPANDDCSGATSLVIGTPLVSGNTNGATASTNVPAAFSGTADDDIWYSFVATSTFTQVTVAPGSGYNAVFEVYNSPCPTSSSTRIIGVNAVGTAQTESATLATVIGQTFFVRVYHNLNGLVL